jgi:hypothetical protein
VQRIHGWQGRPFVHYQPRIGWQQRSAQSVRPYLFLFDIGTVPIGLGASRRPIDRYRGRATPQKGQFLREG